MINGKCSNPDCVVSVSCHLGHDDVVSCENFTAARISPATGDANKKVRVPKKSNFPWSGEAMKIEDLPKVAFRNIPIVIGIVGKADAGKTTFIAMLYTLLLRGETIASYDFAGSKTLLSWDELYHKLKVFKNKVEFPEPTPQSYNRLHHLALKNKRDKLYDVFLSDASGEVFSRWSQNMNDPYADNARWIHENSQAFILFVDCDDLSKRMNPAKTEIIDMAEMMKHNLGDRPVIAVWSKADIKDKIHETLQSSLSKELAAIFPNFHELDISNFSKEDPDKLVHSNNLAVIEHLLTQVRKKSNEQLKLTQKESTDPFFNLRDYE